MTYIPNSVTEDCNCPETSPPGNGHGALAARATDRRPGQREGCSLPGSQQQRPGNGKLRGWRRAGGLRGWWPAESAGKADSQPLGAACRLPAWVLSAQGQVCCEGVKWRMPLWLVTLPPTRRGEVRNDANDGINLNDSSGQSASQENCPSTPQRG